MTEAEILARLTRWQTAIRECWLRLEALDALIGTVPEGPLPEAVGRVMGAYTATVADLIGWDAPTLESWWLEHNFGERPMLIGFNSEPLRTVDNIEALAAFIAEDLRRSAE